MTQLQTPRHKPDKNSSEKKLEAEVVSGCKTNKTCKVQR